MIVLIILSLIVMGAIGLCSLFAFALADLGEDRWAFGGLIALCALVIVTLSLALSRLP
jgi:hypothetical protein